MQPKLKVAQILAGAAVGGAENFYVRLVAALNASRITEQRAFLRPHQQRLDRLRDRGVATERFRFGAHFNLFDRWQYHRALQAYQPDIVMTWMNRACKLTPRGNYLLLARLGHYYNLKYYRHADYWVGISKGICDHLISGGMPAKRVFHIPNFADESILPAVARGSFATPSDHPILLAAGRLHVNKGFDVLLRALADIPDAILWLAGSGPEEATLKSLSVELKVDERVRFLGWRNDVTALMQTADIFVCPSRYEGLGSIVMESWAHQCPIVATASEGPGEVIEHGVTGLLTPVDEVAPLSAAINQLLQSPHLCQTLVYNANEHYRQIYSKKVIVEQYERLYLELSQKGR